MKQLIIFFLFSYFLGSSQERTIFFGKVTDNLGELENVHIINLNTKGATYTNPQGQFKLFAKVKDSIKITSVGYKTEIITLKTTDFGITEKQIHLKKEIIELDEVNVKKNNLIGSLSSDIKNVKTKEEVSAETLKLPNAGNRKLTVAERRLHTAMTSSAGIPVDYFLNLISGRIKKLKNFKKIEDNEKHITYLKNTFTNYAIQDLKIDSTDVSRFIYYCQESRDYKHIKSKNDFTLIEYLKEKSKEFKELNKKE